jgi:hypothetical protein
MDSPVSEDIERPADDRPLPATTIEGRVETFRPRLTFEHVSRPGAMRPVATVGSAAPFSRVWAGETGRWVALCQGSGPSSSDEVGHHGEVAEDIGLHLVVGGGAGVRISGLAAEPTGRWVMATSGSTLELRDTTRDVVTRLTGVAELTEEDTGYLQGSRFASFDPGGSHVLYLRRNGDQLRAVVRELATGRETEIDPGRGTVWRASLTHGARWARFDIIAGAPPHQRTSLSSNRCRGPFMSASWGETSGDAPVARFVAVSSRRVVEGAIAALGRSLIRRTDGGGLELVDEAGGTAPIAPASCEPRIVWGDHGTERLAVDCRRDARFVTTSVFVRGGRAPIERVNCRLESDLPDLVLGGYDHVAWLPQSRLLACWDGAVLDIRNVTLVQDGRARVLATSGSAALLAYEDRLTVRDIDDRTDHVLARGDFRHNHAVSAGPIAAYAGYVVDLAERRLRGTYSGVAYAASADGRVLVGRAPSSEGRYRLPRGPLTWLAAAR